MYRDNLTFMTTWPRQEDITTLLPILICQIKHQPRERKFSKSKSLGNHKSPGNPKGDNCKSSRFSIGRKIPAKYSHRMIHPDEESGKSKVKISRECNSTGTTFMQANSSQTEKSSHSWSHRM
ncbi:hypothetical protein J6590_038425 [Homalodisca vitripennis]|nr:hypothetical protein J6590_038425 [Homalodisca vitripennis]